MVQSREGLRLLEPGRGWRGRRGHFHSHGNGSPIADRRPAAGPATGSADRRGPEGPDGRRTSRTLIARALALGMIASLPAVRFQRRRAGPIASWPGTGFANRHFQWPNAPVYRRDRQDIGAAVDG